MIKVAAFAAELHILRLAADRGVLEHAVALAQHGVALDDGVRADFAARADDDILLDDRIGSDLDILRKLRARVDDGSGVDCHCGSLDRSRPLVNQEACAHCVSPRGLRVMIFSRDVFPL